MTHRTQLLVVDDQQLLVDDDAELIELARTGDMHAYGELFRRHRDHAYRVARATSSFDADDLVAEAFRKVLEIMQRGGGPQRRFGAYLATSVKRTAYNWARARREYNVLESVPEPIAEGHDHALEDDRALVRDAFRALPTRWQEVLWYAEVEGLTSAEIGAIFGMSANAVNALAFRARAGLRREWSELHTS